MNNKMMWILGGLIVALTGSCDIGEPGESPTQDFESVAISGESGAAANIQKRAVGDFDLIIHNGNIITVDVDFSHAEALAVKDGVIVAVGSSQELLKNAGTDTRVVDLQGKTVLPGFNDTHSHIVTFGRP